MDDLLREFLTETSESLSQLDVELVHLEQKPNDPNLLSSIFRLVHTIKGTCGFLGLPRLEHVAHAAENVLGKFRDNELKVTPDAVTIILRSIDTIKTLLGCLEETGTEPPGNDAELIDTLNTMANGGAPTSAAPATDSLEALFAPEPAQPVVQTQEQLQEEKIISAETHAVETEPKTPASPLGMTDKASKESSISSQSIRLDVGLLENLMTTVSELVLTRNQLMQILRSQKDLNFAVPLQRLNQVTSELQEGVMKTRMQPIGNAWSKLPRIIRDLSHELGKKIDLQMIGQDTELDRQVLELIKDPLTHMVRNSADHGIETPDDRLLAGKEETGTIILNAYHQGGHILIEISDDGKGLALSKIKAKALQNGLASESELASMSDQQIMQFIFRAGFSTAAKVTSVSGRGVGMDVVRTNIEKIGGTVNLQSTEGKGSCFSIKIPLTLAIVSALIVECSNERFAIPQLNVVELVTASDDGEHRIEEINHVRVLRLRNRLLPLISLHEALHLKGRDNYSDLSSIIVVQVGGSMFGILVDRVFDTEEIVVKPVSPILSGISVFSGNTILGDGSVVMILDPNGLSAFAVDLHAPSTQVRSGQAAHKSSEEGWQSLLLFHAGDNTPKALPLSLIARLENIDRSLIEFSHKIPMVQYRGDLMPLISLAGDYDRTHGGEQPVIVFSDGDNNVGVLADDILDIVEEKVSVNNLARHPGCFGSAIICGKATDMVDIAHYLAATLENWTENHPDSAAACRRKLLLLDENRLSRNLLTPFLEAEGYSVTPVASPSDAFKLYESGENFDAIISDIDACGTGANEFALMIRREGRWSKLPLLALIGSDHQEPPKDTAFTDMVTKFNRQGIVEALHTALDAPMEHAP